MTNYINIQNQDYTFIGNGSQITGKFHFKGHTRVAGHIEGEITMIDDHDLSIESTGQFEGTINCHNIDIYGVLNGKINATGKISIYPSALVQGEIKGRSLKILPGARVDMSGHTLEKSATPL